MSEAQNLVELVLRSLDANASTFRLHWREENGTGTLDARTLVRTTASVAGWLRAQGVVRGDRVGIACSPCPEWIVFDLAALSLGAITVPFFANLSPEHLAWELRDSGSKVVLCGDAAQSAQIQAAAPGTLPVVVSGAPAGEVPWERLASHPADVEDFRRSVAEILDTNIATIIYTSGSTGRPKGVVLDHGGMVAQVEAARIAFPADPTADFGLSCLPLAHVFERIVTYFHLASGHPLAISRDVQQVSLDLLAFRPTIFTVVPRLLEKLLAKVDAQVDAARGIRRWIGRAARRESERERHALSPLLEPIFDALVWAKVRKAMGERLRLVVSGGAALPSVVEIRMRRMGLPILEGYGLTEHSPVVAVNTPAASRPGTVGRLFHGVEARTESDSELLVRSRSVFKGYWNRPEETAEAIGPDGWLRTGDLASIDADGFLKLVGRKKDLCKTAGGKYVAPTPIEEALARHPLVEHAVVCADGRKFVSAVLALDPQALQARARAAGSDPVHAASSTEVELELSEHVRAVNASLDEWEKVRRWVVSPLPFTIEGGELTPTLKVRRSLVLSRHSAALDALYA